MWRKRDLNPWVIHWEGSFKMVPIRRCLTSYCHHNKNRTLEQEPNKTLLSVFGERRQRSNLVVRKSDKHELKFNYTDCNRIICTTTWDILGSKRRWNNNYTGTISINCNPGKSDICCHNCYNSGMKSVSWEHKEGNLLAQEKPLHN